jgi:hypothetical protein
VKWKLIKNGTIKEIHTFDLDETYTYILPDPTLVYDSHSKASIQYTNTSSFSIDTENNNIQYTNYFTMDKDDPGETVASGYITNDKVTSINTKSIEYITSSITGVSDVYSLMLYYVNSDAEVQFSLDWEEYE